MWEGVNSTKCYRKIENNFIIYSHHSRKECGNRITPLNLKEMVICELMNLGTISYTILHTMLIDTQQTVEQNIPVFSIFNICRVLFVNYCFTDQQKKNLLTVAKTKKVSI